MPDTEIITEACEFFFVWTKKGHVPRRTHDTFGSATTEAKRLALLHPGRKYIVLGAMEKFHVEETPDA